MEILFDIIEKYGLWGACVLIGCMGIFLLFKWLSNKLSEDMTSGLEKVGEKLTDQMSQQNKKLTNVLAEQQSQLTNTIVDQQNKLLDHLINKDSRDTVNHNKMLNKRIELAEEINNTLRDIMNIHNSQRAFIIEFHNSYENLSGVPFAKYSCTYEWFEKGLMPLANKIMGLPFAQMAKVVNDIINSDNQQKVYTDLDLMEHENPSLFALIKDDRTKAIVYDAMYDRHNQLIGCLVLEYQIPLKEGHLNLDQLKVQTAELTSILNIRYKYSKDNYENKL